MDELEMIHWEIDPEEEEDVVEDPGELTRQIIFSLGSEWYGVDTELAELVMKVPVITNVPFTPDFVRGIVNIRGNIVVVVDISGFLGLNIINQKKESRIMVVKIQEKTTGILLDSVSDILNISLKSIQPPISTLTGLKSDFVKGELKLPDGRFLTLLDLVKLMTSDLMMSISTKIKEKQDVGRK